MSWTAELVTTRDDRYREGMARYRLRAFGRVEILGVDRHRVLTLFAGGGLIVGSLLAVFGMPPLELHGPLHHLGIMSPTCGMTRGVAALLRGDARAAWLYNPASFLVVAGAVVVLVRGAVGVSTGRWLTFVVDVTRVGWVAITTVMVALWVNQQAHATLLMMPA